MTDIIRLKDTMHYSPDLFNMKGHVTIRDQKDNVLVDKDNHIVLTGRQWLMQRMFNMSSTTPDSDVYSWLPGWFSVGSGGTAQDSPFTPIWPADEDTDLYNPETFTSDNAQYSVDKKHKIVDSIEFPNELTTKLTMTLDYDDLTDAYLNEAGMFVGKSTTYTNTDFILFSHVTFPSFPKSQYQKLTIEWMFLF